MMKWLRKIFNRTVLIRIVIGVFVLENVVLLVQNFASHPDEVVITLSKVQNGHTQIISTTDTTLNIEMAYKDINGLSYSLPDSSIAFMGLPPQYPSTYYTYQVQFKHWGIPVETAKTDTVVNSFSFSGIFNIPENRYATLAVSWDEWHGTVFDNNTFPQITNP